MIGAEHTNSRAELGASKRHHMLANMGSHHFSVLWSGVVEDPLHKVVAVLITGNVNQGNARAITTTLTNPIKVTTEEVRATNLEALLHNFRRKLIRTVLSSVSNNMVDGAAAIRRGAMLANVLNAPITKLPVSNDVDVGKDFFNAGALYGLVSKGSGYSINLVTYLVLFQTIFKNILHDEAPSLSESHLVPHATEGLIDKLHNLRRRLCPPQLKKLLPDMAGVSMNDCVGDAAQKFVNHDGLVIFRDGIKCFLNNMASEGVHGKVQGVASNCFGDFDDLLRCAMLEASLYKKVPKPVDHQGVGLGNDGLNNFVFLFRGPHLQLLLQEYGSLLIIVANNLIHDVLPIAVDISIEETSVVERLGGCKVRRSIRGH